MSSNFRVCIWKKTTAIFRKTFDSSANAFTAHLPAYGASCSDMGVSQLTPTMAFCSSVG